MKNKMKALFGGMLLVLVSCATQQEEKWELDWQDEFDGPQLDESVWGRTERGKPDWANTQSKDERCMEFRDGKLVLRGIVNDDLEADTARYLTGGIWTKNKKAFEPGRFEIRCKLQAATGAWPAIWLLPFEHEKYPWPTGGEIDIMERLNFDDFAYQTVHSTFTRASDVDIPPHSGTSPINPDDFNVYGVDIHSDSIVFHINGERTYVYPRIEGDSTQFPFYIQQYLLIDMQLGGNWVGDVDPAQLPVEMEIDWVKHYVKKKGE